MKSNHSRSKKVLNLTLGILLIFCVGGVAHADSPAQPTMVSFIMSPNSVDIATPNNIVAFELVVTNPTGIATSQTSVTFTDGAHSTLVTNLYRIDNPVINSLAKVTFRGTLTLPPTIAAGVYSATSGPIVGLNANGSLGLSTQALSATSTSTLVGAEGGLLVRSAGNLNYNYPTFIGPTFNNISGVSFTNPKYTAISAPIWKIGESFDPNDYYQTQVPTLKLKVKANTLGTCTSNGSILTFIAVGSCSFTVFTDANQDYQYYKDDEVENITASRTKPTYTVGTISTQSSSTLPLSIQGPFIYGPLGLIIPASATPTVCYATGTYINIISGGICTLNYSSPASSNYLASDVFPLTFQISRQTQTVSFAVPTQAQLSRKTVALTATSSSGGPVTFQSDSPTICSVTGNSLNLLTAGNCQVEATQAGSATVSPASLTHSIAVTGTLPASKTGKAKTIICVKSGKSKSFTGSKCPGGFKAKK